MAFDASRPVPWKRLFGYFAIYAVIFIGISVLFNGLDIGLLVGLVFGAVLYLGVAVLLVKFGWNPPGLKREQAMVPTPEAPTSQAVQTTSGPKPKPAPTNRTSTGATNRPRRTRDSRKG